MSLQRRLPPGTRKRLVDILATRYPCRAIPAGDLDNVAEELGISRDRVNALVNNIWGVSDSASKFIMSKPTTLVICAGSCGRTYPESRAPSSGFCPTCTRTRPMVSCSYCGKLFQRHLGRLVRAARKSDRPRTRVPYTAGTVFCGTSCFRKYCQHERLSVPS